MTPDRLNQLRDWHTQYHAQFGTIIIGEMLTEIERLQAIQDRAEAVYCLVEYHSEDSVLVPREAMRALGDVLEGAQR